jgi:hypothetical protein
MGATSTKMPMPTAGRSNGDDNKMQAMDGGEGGTRRTTPTPMAGSYDDDNMGGCGDGGRGAR